MPPGSESLERAWGESAQWLWAYTYMYTYGRGDRKDTGRQRYVDPRSVYTGHLRRHTDPWRLGQRPSAVRAPRQKTRPPHRILDGWTHKHSGPVTHAHEP